MIGERLSPRLHLVPIGPAHVEDLVLIHAEAWVALWYGGPWTFSEAQAFADAAGKAWEELGVAKWMAYHREDNDLVGRGGLSRMMDDDPTTDQIAKLVGRRWSPQRLEVGWAIREAYRGQGYASELGREALSYAFHILGASCVIAFTERHNRASRAVMERIGMRYRGEIVTRGLIEGDHEEHDEAPFSVYAIDRPIGSQIAMTVSK